MYMPLGQLDTQNCFCHSSADESKHHCAIIRVTSLMSCGKKEKTRETRITDPTRLNADCGYPRGKAP